MPYEPTDVDVAIHLRELGEGVVDDMLALELSAILVEAVRHEHGNVIHPRITRRRRQQDPVIVLDDLQELGGPLSTTNQSLLVKYEERSLNVSVLGDVVPAVDGDDPGVDSWFAQLATTRP